MRTQVLCESQEGRQGLREVQPEERRQERRQEVNRFLRLGQAESWPPQEENEIVLVNLCHRLFSCSVEWTCPSAGPRNLLHSRQSRRQGMQPQVLCQSSQGRQALRKVQR